MQYKSINFWSLLLLTTFLSVIAGCGSKKKNNTQEAIRPVKYEKISYENAKNARTYVGVSEAYKDIKLSFQVSGKIDRMLVKRGDRVKKGQLIATLEDEDLQLKLDQAIASKNQAKVNYTTASSELNRIKGLYENNSVSLSDYEKAKSNYATSKANYQESLKNVNLSQRQLNYTKLYAPIDGIISSKDAYVNENIQTGTTIFILSTANKIQVRVGLPSNFIDQVKNHQPVNIRFSSISGKTFQGEVQEISYIKSSSSSTYPVKVGIKNPSKNIRPGMSAEVTFLNTQQGQKKMIFLPPDAVFVDQSGKSFVYVIQLESENVGILKKQEVQIGELTDNGFVLKSGIRSGDLVVTAGVANLKDRLKVKLLNRSNTP